MYIRCFRLTNGAHDYEEILGRDPVVYVFVIRHTGYIRKCVNDPHKWRKIHHWLDQSANRPFLLWKTGRCCPADQGNHSFELWESEQMLMSLKTGWLGFWDLYHICGDNMSQTLRIRSYHLSEKNSEDRNPLQRHMNVLLFQQRERKAKNHQVGLIELRLKFKQSVFAPKPYSIIEKEQDMEA